MVQNNEHLTLQVNTMPKAQGENINPEMHVVYHT